MMYYDAILSITYQPTNEQGDSCIHDAYIYDPLSLNLSPDVCMMHISMILGPDTYFLALDPDACMYDACIFDHLS